MVNRKMPKWTREDLQEAVQQVKSKQMSMNRASKVYGISVGTLYNHYVHGICSKVGAGRPTILTYDEERDIVYSCQVGNQYLKIVQTIQCIHIQFHDFNLANITMHSMILSVYYTSYFQVLQEMGFGLTRENVGAIVMEYLQAQSRPNPFKAERPGYDWWEGFMKRCMAKAH